MKYLSCLFLLFPLSMAIADDLVTITGQLDPKFSVEVSERDMIRIQSEIFGLENLPPIKININDLMEPGDEAAIKKAANNIASKFLRASQILIDLRIIIYRLDALSQLSDNSEDLGTIRRTFADKFSARYLEMLGVFALLENDLKEALIACRSELCVSNIAGAQREVIEFARAINKRKNLSSKLKNPLLQAVVEDGYDKFSTQTADSAQEPYPQMVKSAFSGWVSTTRSGEEPKGVLEKFLGKKKKLKSLGLWIPKLPRRVYASELGWLKQIVGAKLKSLILKKPFELSERESFHRTHLLGCRQYGDDWGGRYQLFVYGRSAPLQCVSLRDGSHYEFNSKVYGPGLRLSGVRWFMVVIVSPTPVEIPGVWRGPSVGVGAFYGGGELAWFFGKKGSTALLFGPSIGDLGVHAGIEVMNLKSVYYRRESYD